MGRHTLAYSGILWHTLAYSGILWHTLAYSGILLHTQAYSGILWHTLAYSGILWDTLAYSGTGLHKLWYPVVRDRSTWSKFGAHGERGDVFGELCSGLALGEPCSGPQRKASLHLLMFK